MTNRQAHCRHSAQVAHACALGVLFSCALWVAQGLPAVAATDPVGQQAPQGAPAPQADQPVPTFRSAVDLVTVDVSVVDDNGRPVRGLGVDDFRLKVDGDPRPIVSAQFIEQHSGTGPAPSTQYSTNEGTEGGRLVMLVVDQGNIRPGAAGAFVRAADRLLDDLGPGDRVSVSVIPGGKMMEFTRHLSIVRRALRQVVGSADMLVTKSARTRVGVAEALAYRRGDVAVVREVDERECGRLFNIEYREFCVSEVTQEMDQLAADVSRRTTNTLTVLRQILGDLARIDGPKTVVLLTEGLYVDREIGLLNTVGGVAAQARASMYAIVLDDTHADFDVTSSGVSPTSGADRELRLAGISALVGYTRGAAFTVTASAGTAFERLAREMRGYYLIAFEPLPGERDGKSHNIDVRVERRKVAVRARREFAVSMDASRQLTTDELIAEALRAPLPATGLPLRVATYSFPDPEVGRVRVLITAGLGRVTDDAPVTALGYRVTDADGRFVVGHRYDVDPPLDDDHRWNGTVTLAPGTYTLKVASLDGDGRRASVEHQFTAELAQAGELLVGDLMLSEGSGDGELRPEIEPLVGGAALEGYLEVSSSNAALLRGVAVTLEIAGEPNAPALMKAEAGLSATRDQVRSVASATVALNALPPGEYVARAIVSTEGRPVARVLRPFSYVPGSAVTAAAATTALSAFSARFDPAQVLSPVVTGHYLGPLAQEVGPVAARRLEVASSGDYSALAEGAGDDAPPGVSALMVGVSWYAKGELELAAKAFRQALAEDGGMSAATFYLAACYAAGGKHKEAAAGWQTTIAVEDQPAFVYALAIEAFMRAKNWEAAESLADEAEALWPDRPDVQRLHVRTIALGSDRRAALAAIDRYVGRQPSDHEMVLLGMKLLYDANADGRPVVSPVDDRRKYEAYLARYRAAEGPELALAERWLETLPGAESRK